MSKVLMGVGAPKLTRIRESMKLTCNRDLNRFLMSMVLSRLCGLLGLGALYQQPYELQSQQEQESRDSFFQKAFSNTADLHRSLKSRCFVPSLGFGCAPWSVRCRCSAGLSDARPLSAIGHTRNGRLVGRCDSGQAGLGLRGLREHKSGCPDQGRAKLKKVRLRRTLPKNLTGNRNVPGAPDGLYNPGYNTFLPYRNLLCLRLAPLA